MEYFQLLNYVLNELESKHPCVYFSVTKDELEEYIKQLVNNIPLDNEFSFNYVMKCVIAKLSGIYDQHTSINQPYKWLPIAFKYIDNKLYIVDGNDENKFKYVTKINGIDIDILINEFKETIPTLTDERLKMYLEWPLRGFNNMYVIKSLPSISNNTQSIEFELNDKTKLDFNYETQYEYPFKEKEDLGLTYIDDIPVVAYRRCRDTNGSMSKLIEMLKGSNSDKFIIDLRSNFGGNSDIINPLCEFLKDKKVDVLTDYNVFSSGAWGVMYLKNIGATVIGTKLGMPLNGFGHIGNDRIELPGTDLYVQYSCKFFKTSLEDGKYKIISIKNKKDLMREYEENPESFRILEFEPDIYVEPTLEDYMKDTDSILNTALSYLQGLEITEQKNR